MTDTRMPKPPSTLTVSKFSNLSDVFVLGEGGEYTQNVEQLSHDEWAKTFYICGVSSLVNCPSSTRGPVASHAPEAHSTSLWSQSLCRHSPERRRGHWWRQTPLRSPGFRWHW